MSKSLGNIYKLDDLKNHFIDPLAIRYLFLQSHYRQLTNFTWEAAKASQEALNKLKEIVSNLKKEINGKSIIESEIVKNNFHNEFKEAIMNDLQTAQAVAVMWEMLKSNILPQQKLDLLFDFDKIFGLKLKEEIVEEKIPNEIIKLAEKRKIARKNKNFSKSDEIRKEIEKLGYQIEDKNEIYSIKKI